MSHGEMTNHFHDHNHFLAVRDALVMIKLGVHLNTASNTAGHYHNVNFMKLTNQVKKIIDSTKTFHETYDLKDTALSTGKKQLPDWYYKSSKKEGPARDVRVDKIIKLVKERYNIK